MQICTEKKPKWFLKKKTHTERTPPPPPTPHENLPKPIRRGEGRGGGIFPGITESVNQKVQIKKKQITFKGKRFI